MTIGQLLKELSLILAECSETPKQEVAFILKKLVPDDVPISVVSDFQIDSALTQRVYEAANRRKEHEPLQYILGEWEFYGLPFVLNDSVLIPRPDTEILVEKAIEVIRSKSYRHVLDLCSGSGCIGISIAKHTDCRVTFIDILKDAIDTARINAKNNGVTGRFFCGDLFSAIPSGEMFQMICCNPPYLSETDMNNLQKEVRFEPETALYGGKDGLDFYRRIAKTYRNYLETGGCMLLEIGSDQAEAIKEIFPGCSLMKDYSGHQRTVYIEYTK